MNTRFSPSLNGSLHLGHLYMAWVNQTYARTVGGTFILRFDDLAPRLAGDNVTDMPRWAKEAEAHLCQTGLIPDKVTYLSSYIDPNSDFPPSVGGNNKWLRAENLEGHHNLSCSPMLVSARVKADIAEDIGAVIRGEELLPELQLYEYLNTVFKGPSRELVYLPRLRVRWHGEVTTISKTVGNLQLRDLYQQATPKEWLERVKQVILRDPTQPLSWTNLNPDPVINLDEERYVSPKTEPS